MCREIFSDSLIWCLPTVAKQILNCSGAKDTCLPKKLLLFKFFTQAFQSSLYAFILFHLNLIFKDGHLQKLCMHGSAPQFSLIDSEFVILIFRIWKGLKLAMDFQLSHNSMLSTTLFHHITHMIKKAQN